jgi:hypothetical protein
MSPTRCALTCVVAIASAGCAGKAALTSADPPDGHARIRVFHGPAVFLFPGKSCFDLRDKHRIRAARGGYSFLSRNRTLGMPKTADMTWSFNEYSVTAGEPLTVMMYWGVQSSMEYSTPLGMQANVHGESCGPVAYTFVPESGGDYDTRMLFQGGYCRAGLRKLLRKGSDPETVAEAMPFPAQPAGPCTAETSNPK